MQSKFELELAKSILQWLVTIKILTPLEAARVDELNRQGFQP
jgi:hypothetical protein